MTKAEKLKVCRQLLHEMWTERCVKPDYTRDEKHQWGALATAIEELAREE